MSFLDLYQGNQQQAMAPALNEGHSLPATFGESFRAAWDYGRMFSASNAGENARFGAVGDYLDEVRDKTGKDVPVDWGAYFGGGDLLDQVNGAVAKINAGRPSTDAVPPLTAEDLDRRAVAKARQSGIDLAEISQREHSGLGLLTGGLASAATDPINLLALPIAPEAGTVSVLSAALRWGAVAGMSQAAIEAAGGSFREQVQPGYLQSGAVGANILEAFGAGAVLGGGFKALGNAWTRFKTGSWPTSVRDAGNLVESEANVANANLFRGAGEEAAHRDAMVKGIDDALNERPVDVSEHITPAMERQLDERFAPLMAERDQAATALREAQSEQAGAAPELPFEQTAAGARAQDHLDAMADQIARLAKEGGYSMPPSEAAQIAERMARGTDEEAQAQVNRIFQQPNTAAEAMPHMQAPATAERPAPVDPQAFKASVERPEYEAALQGDIDRERARDLSVQVPVDVDKEGNPIFRPVDGMADEVEAYRKVADQIAACASPAAAEGA